MVVHLWQWAGDEAVRQLWPIRDRVINALNPHSLGHGMRISDFITSNLKPRHVNVDRNSFYAMPLKLGPVISAFPKLVTAYVACK